jgi:hypothetical protein
MFNTAQEACIAAQEASQEGCEVGGIAQDNDAAQESRLPSWLHFIMGIKTIRALPVRKTKAESTFDGALEDDGVVFMPEDVNHIQETDPVFLVRVGALQYPSAYATVCSRKSREYDLQRSRSSMNFSATREVDLRTPTPIAAAMPCRN